MTQTIRVPYSTPGGSALVWKESVDGFDAAMKRALELFDRANVLMASAVGTRSVARDFGDDARLCSFGADRMRGTVLSTEACRLRSAADWMLRRAVVLCDVACLLADAALDYCSTPVKGG